jgi:hypothetical protein
MKRSIVKPVASETGHSSQLAILTEDVLRMPFPGCARLASNRILYSTLAALTHPALFSSLILIDPVIVKPKNDITIESVAAGQLVLGALMRRDTWPSQYIPLSPYSQLPDSHSPLQKRGSPAS